MIFDNNTCDTCALYMLCDHFKIKPKINTNIKYILISEFPILETSIVMRILESSIDLSQVYLTSLVKCVPLLDPLKGGKTRPPSEYEIKTCFKYLAEELRNFDDSIPIMTLGNLVLESFIGKHSGITNEINKVHSYKFEEKTFRLVPNFNPVATISNSYLLPQFKQVFSKLKNNNVVNFNSEEKTKILEPQEAINHILDIITKYENKEISWTMFDIETSGLVPWTSDIIMFSFAHDSLPYAFSVPLQINNEINFAHLMEYEKFVAELGEETAKERLKKEYTLDMSIQFYQAKKIQNVVRLLLETVPIVGHNLKFDIKFCVVKLGVDINKVNIHADTLVMAHQVYGREFGSSLGLKELCRKTFNIEDDWDISLDFYIKKYRLTKDRSYSNLPTKLLGVYAALDVYYNKQLYYSLLNEIQPVCIEITQEVTKAIISVVDAETKGIAVDNNMLQFLKTQYENHITSLTQKIYSLPTVLKFINDKMENELIPENSKKRKPLSKEELILNAFSINSNPQLKKILFDKDYFNLPVNDKFKTEKGDLQTSKEVLKYYLTCEIETEVREFLESLTLYKDYNKLYTTYIEGLPESIFDGTYKSDFSITGTITGRWSSGFHTLPSKSDIKRVFNSRFTNGLFLCCDMSQLELRICASIANETKMIDSYKKGIDLHTNTASLIFKKPIEEVSDKERKIGKTFNFAILYGKQAQSLAEDLKCTIQEAEKFLEAFFIGYPTLTSWIKKQQNEVKKDGFVLTKPGRIIPVKEALSGNKRFMGEVERKSVNYMIQSSAADIVMVAANKVYNYMRKINMKSIYLGSVHDSVEYDVHPGELLDLVFQIKKANEVYIKNRWEWITCPLVMDVSVGTSWGGAIECKVKSYSQDSLLLEGEGLRKDVLKLKNVLENSYKTQFDITHQEKIEKFSSDIFYRDTEIYKFSVLLHNM